MISNVAALFCLTLKLYLYGESAFVEVKVRVSLVWWSVGGSNSLARLKALKMKGGEGCAVECNHKCNQKRNINLPLRFTTLLTQSD